MLRAAVENCLSRMIDHAGFGDPEFMGRYALNVLDPENWMEVEGGRAYRSPPDEATHLERLGARHGGLVRESDMEARIQLAIDGTSTQLLQRHGMPLSTRGGLPDDSDTNSLKSRSTRLIATALLVARDGDDDVLDEHEGWGTRRHSAGARGAGGLLFWLQGEPALQPSRARDTRTASSLAQARFESGSRCIGVDCGAQGSSRCSAFAAALPMIADKDARLLKAAMRAAFAGYVRRWSLR